MREIHSLTEIADTYDVYFIDMFGTIWDGNGFYPAICETFAALKARGKRIVMLSNATILSHQMVDKIQAKGLKKGIHFDEFITSGDVFLDKMRAGFLIEFTGKKEFKFYIIGADNLTLFADVAMHQTRDIAAADFVYISSLDTKDGYAFTLDKFIPEMERGIALKKPAICANPDITVVRDNAPHFVNGAAAKWYEENGGQVVYIGKPYPEIYTYALDLVDVKCDKSVMVGDSLLTDILGANRAGMASVLITETGVASTELKTQSLDVWCATHQAHPDFILERVK